MYNTSNDANSCFYAGALHDCGLTDAMNKGAD